MLDNLKKKRSEDAARWSSQLLMLAAKKNISEVQKLKKQIVSVRPFDSLTHNAISFITYDLKKNDIILPKISEKVKQVENYFDESTYRIAVQTAMRIKNGCTVATYGNSLIVLQALLHAKRKGKNFTVNVLESRGAGKFMATELINEKIKVVYFEDTAARLALKHSDILLFGCHALSKKGHAIAAIGSELLSEAALKHNCKVYIVCPGWKYDAKGIFKHDESEEVKKAVWENAPKNVVVNRYKFETLNDNAYTAIITEVGVHRPGYLVKELLEKYPWMRQSWFK